MTDTRMDKDKLVELAERCEAATGPDRELDALIYAEQLGEVEWVGNTLRAAGVNLGAIDPGEHQRNFTLWYQRTPDYTGSLDAAMTLVPEGCGFTAQHLGHPVFWTVFVPGGEQFEGHGATPALALCAAALRSHAQPK